MTRIIHGTGVTHGAGDGLSEFPSDLADVGTAGSAVAFSVQASDTSALVTLASCIRGSDASALPMRVLVAGPAAAVADSTDTQGCGGILALFGVRSNKVRVQTVPRQENPWVVLPLRRWGLGGPA